MRISWLKLDNDNKNFRIPANLGMDVFSVNSTENVDNKIDELISDDKLRKKLGKEASKIGSSRKIKWKY